MGLLNNISDLIPGFGNPFGLPSQGLWNLQQGSFTIGQSTGGVLGSLLNLGGGLFDKSQTVTFYVENSIGQAPGQLTAMESINDSGGRRLAVYEYPYVDGQALQDLGRKGERFTMNIKFFGNNYQILFKSFIEIVTRNNGKGTLNHPVRGSIPARFLEWEFVHRCEEWNAVTIRATFLEDNTGTIDNLNIFDSINSTLRNTLQVVSTVSSTISTALSTAVALKSLPASVLTSLNTGLTSTLSTCSSLLGKLAATYSTDAALKSLMATASSLGTFTRANSGTTTTSGQIPPVYQVGFTASDQTNINSQTSAFVNANQITPQQAMYNANAARTQISTQIAAVTDALGNDGYTSVLQYRILAVQIQTVTQSAIASIQTQVTVYTVPYPMSLRQVAFRNNLSVDRQNDIEGLNPYITSVNYILAGTQLLVPVA